MQKYEKTKNIITFSIHKMIFSYRKLPVWKVLQLNRESLPSVSTIKLATMYKLVLAFLLLETCTGKWLWVKCSEYLHKPDHDDNGTNGFLSPSNTQKCRTFPMVPSQTPRFLVLIAGENMKGTWEIWGKTNKIQRTSHYIATLPPAHCRHVNEQKKVEK